MSLPLYIIKGKWQTQVIPVSFWNWRFPDASTQNILKAHEETVQQYGRLTEDVQRMNATVHHLMDVLHTTKQGVEDKLSWITSLVGGTDNTIQKVYSCVLHACYFFMGMVSASFLQVLLKNIICY